MTFTIRGVTLTADPGFQDSDWLSLQRWCTNPALSSDETLPGRKRAAWQALCEMLPTVAERPWHCDGKIALDISELGDYILWATQQIKSRQSFAAMERKQGAIVKPGFGELLAERSSGMVSFGAEDVSDQMSPDSGFSSEQDAPLPEAQPYDADLIAQQTQESPDAERQGEIESLRARLAALGG